MNRPPNPGTASHEPQLESSSYPPISDYAFISDCQANALIASSGNVEWLCLPRPDSPSIFGAILDRAAGGFRIGPSDVAVPAGRRYLPGTMVLETTWRTSTGWLVVRDALLIGPWYHVERTATHRRPPTDRDAEHVLLRLFECISGNVELHLECEPVLDFGERPVSWSYDGAGYGHLRTAGEDDDLQLQVMSTLRLGLDGRRAIARTTLRAGDRGFAALGWGRCRLPEEIDDADRRIDVTAEFWREWLSRGNFPDHRWSPVLERSALTLKGLTYAPTGAMLAAATTSLPELPGGERNWDYRYSWVRDSTFMLWALYTLGFDQEADDFFAFIADACEGDPTLQVLYGVGGERDLTERVLDHLSGYEFSRPVRVGNGAFRQKQHDIWGAMLDSVYLHTRSRDYLSERTWHILVPQVQTVLASWREPDRGIWEVRGEPKHFTSSKMMCWLAADRGARLAQMRGDLELAADWRRAAKEIHEDICSHAVNRDGVFTQHYQTKTVLDASLLLMPLVRFLPADDPRVQKTVLAIADGLSVHGLLRRYIPDQVDDGVGGDEGAFNICSFWLVSAFAEIGETRRARQLCERMLAAASPLGLYAEELDPLSGRQLGNFPQAFTHLALINAVLHVIRAEQGTQHAFSPGRPLNG